MMRYARFGPAHAAAVLTAIGGFFVLLGGIAMWLLGVVLFAFTGFSGHGFFVFGIVIGLALFAMSALLWYVPRLAFGWGAITLGLAVLSLPFAFFGGFVIGFLAAVAGAIVALASVTRRPSPRIVLS
jgi:hypothetical protein